MNKHMNPIIFHGKKGRKHYFEGWYYKCVSGDERHCFSIIPGIAYQGNNSHCFIQFLDSMSGESYYIKYPMSKLGISNNPFYVRIDKNIFSKTELIIDFTIEKTHIKGEFTLSRFTDIRRSLLSPSIMGFFQYLDFLECYHGIVSMSHKVNGQLSINNVVYDFKNGKGYIEKDWGTSFPKQWIWLHSNSFYRDDISFMVSYAIVPLKKIRIRGLICVVLYKGKEYRFATYNGAKVKKISIKGDRVYMIIEKGGMVLKIKALIKESNMLMAPTLGGMNRELLESVNSVGIIQLEKDGKTIFKKKFRNLCAEIQDIIV